MSKSSTKYDPAAEALARLAAAEPGSNGVPRLALRPREAAQALGIGVRLLWAMTAANEIPHVRTGRAVRYPIDGLRLWLLDRQKGGRRDDR